MLYTHRYIFHEFFLDGTCTYVHMISSFVLGHCSNFMVTFHLSAASVIFFCVGGFVWGVGVCVGAYTSEDFHMKTHRYTEDSTPSEDPKTGPRKTLAKNAKNVMFVPS